jgi:hypothetical protein
MYFIFPILCAIIRPSKGKEVPAPQKSTEGLKEEPTMKKSLLARIRAALRMYYQTFSVSF